MNRESALVFVVDDDRSIRESLSNLIRSAGLSVQTFSSAQEFLASQRSKSPSCLVLDVQLPGLSGLDLQQELAKAGIQIPIIFITGYGDIPMSVRAMKAGALEFLTKPVNDEDLLGAIQQAIARDHRARQPPGRGWAGGPFCRDCGHECCSAGGAQAGGGGGADGIDGADFGRDWHGKRAHRARHPYHQLAL
jgi:DNA-binding NtrC family response regulator